jgi:exonuclease SbcD
MITFIHTADIHFGVENYGKLDQKTGIHSRLLDFEKALNLCIDYAIAQNVDFFLFAGDAYKTANPSPTQQKLLMRCFLRLHTANIPVVIVVGNHDNPLSFGKANSLEIFGDMPLEGFHVIAKPELLVLQTKNGPVQIVGIPWPTRNTISLNKKHLSESFDHITRYIAESVSAVITHYAQQCDPTIPSVLTGHLTVASGVFSGSEKRAIYGNDPTLFTSQLAIEPFDYVALGHLHRYQDLNPHGYPAVVYAGSIERVDFGERKEEKGFCVINLERKKTVHHFRELPTRPFIQIEVTLNDDTEKHTEQLLAKLAEQSIDKAVVKIIYHVPAGVKDCVDIGTIERACANTQYLVGILPIHEVTTRQKRRGMKVETDLATLLDSYFEDRADTQTKKNLLVQKALELYAEADCCEESEN